MNQLLSNHIAVVLLGAHILAACQHSAKLSPSSIPHDDDVAAGNRAQGYSIE